MRMPRSVRSLPVAGALVVALLVVSPTPAAEQSADVTAHDTRADAKTSCPEVVTTGRYITGGCRSTGTSGEVDVATRTVFGALPFAYGCSVTFDLTIAADGRAWLDRLLIGGGGGGVCNDIRPCEPNALTDSPDDKRDARKASSPTADSPADFVPWRGQIRQAGDERYVGRFSICVDTCAGRYDGALELVLVKEGTGWLVRADDAPIGATGLTFTGQWPLTPARFDLAPVG
jgi:hypothetical protein